MSKKDNIQTDREFLSKKIREENINLPNSLSKENITELLMDKKQKTNIKSYIRRFTAIGVAACIVICSLIVFKKSVSAPEKITTAGSEVVFAAEYSDISDILNKYKSENKSHNLSINLFSKSSDTADSVEYGYAEASNAQADSVSDGTAVTTGYSETNLRVASIDEADIVKTDGEYIYAMSMDYNSLYIVKPGENTAELVSKIATAVQTVTSIDGEDVYLYNSGQGYFCNYSDFYVYGDRLIIEKNESSFFEDTEANEQYGDCKDTAGIDIYDISDKANPKLVRTVTFEGYRVSSRIVSGRLLFISTYNVDVFSDSYSEDDYKTYVPATYCDNEASYPVPSQIGIVNTNQPDSYLTVATIDLEDDTSKPQTVYLLGSGSEIYCTAKNLYVFNTIYCYESNSLLDTVAGYVGNVVDNATASDGDSGITTDIISFDISGEAPTVKAKGTIDGYMSDTWSADEYNGYLRVASTDEATCIYVLDEELKLVGKSAEMAKGEWVESVRFSGDTAYVVTFYQTDPLFVVDLSDPTAPEIKGELKLPGFSAYLHPVGEGLMLGVGTDGDDEGADDTAKLSLFDVSNPLEPKEVSNYKLQHADFTASYTYKAFVDVGDGTYIIPYTRYENNTDENGNVTEYYYTQITGAIRIKTEGGEIEVVAQYENGETDGYNPRALYINDRVYVITFSAALNINVFDIADGSLIYTKKMS